MAIDFPNAPATNATYTVGNKTWIYDGTTWNTYNSTSFSAETLPGTTIKSTVTGSSLTSVGTLGSLTVTNATTSGSFIQGTNYLSPYQGFRNHLINGGFDVWQRGTSSASTGVVAADRWYNAASGTTTFSQDASDFPTGVGVMYSNKWTTGAASSFGQIFQAIESSTVSRLRGSTVTLSGWVKRGATWTGSLYFQMFYSTSSDAYSSQTVAVTGTSDQIIPTTSWVRYSTTFTVPSNAVGLKVGIVPTDVQASSTVVYFAGMQLERGSVATPFEQRPMQTELALCQRYFQKSYGTSVTVGTSTDLGFYAFYGTGNLYGLLLGTVQLRVPMRVTPTTITYYRSGGANLTGWDYGNTSGTTGTANPTTAYATDTSFTPYVQIGGSYASGNMYGHWVASAEL